jgi:hypothetical protein
MREIRQSGSEGGAAQTQCAVPRQGEEDLWQRHKAERGLWSEKMLMDLETGSKETSGSAS